MDSYLQNMNTITHRASFPPSSSTIQIHTLGVELSEGPSQRYAATALSWELGQLRGMRWASMA